jgi:hypothetical protein
MSQEILNRLAILSIEQNLLENIEYKILISNFVAEIVKSNFSMIFFFKDRRPRFFFLHHPKPHNSGECMEEVLACLLTNRLIV